MRRLMFACIVSAMAWTSPAWAVIGTADNVPAATLLVPYFEVDLASPTGVTTLFTIHNTSASATMVHLTAWTDLGIPSFDMDIYLTGYDLQAINLRDIFVEGNLSRTASAGQDPSDTISPQGRFSQDINFASCNGQLPFTNPALNSAFLAHLQAWHSGSPSPTTGTCAGVNHGDGILRGYLTADVSNACSVQFPGDPGYFVSGGQGVAGNRNILVGDYMIIDPGNNFMDADRAVAIEADASNPLTDGQDDYTFYGRLVGFSGADNREALPNLWGARYMTEGSAYRVWRDPAVPLPVAGFSCALPYPAGYPLSAVQVVAFDTQENPTSLPGDRFPYATLQVDVDAGGLPAPAKQGWMYLTLDSASSLGPPPGTYRQAWVTVLQNHQGRFSAGWPAVQLGTRAGTSNPPPLTGN